MILWFLVYCSRNIEKHKQTLLPPCVQEHLSNFWKVLFFCRKLLPLALRGSSAKRSMNDTTYCILITAGYFFDEREWSGSIHRGRHEAGFYRMHSSQQGDHRAADTNVNVVIHSAFDEQVHLETFLSKSTKQFLTLKMPQGPTVELQWFDNRLGDSCTQVWLTILMNFQWGCADSGCQTEKKVPVNWSGCFNP